MIARHYWRDRNSNEPLFAVIRRPESLWKMSYGYFWRTKCSVSPQGKPWIAGVGITWKEGPGWCAWHLSLKESLFCSHCHRSPSEETVQKGPEYLWILLWKINRRLVQLGERKRDSENEFCNISSEFTGYISGDLACNTPFMFLSSPQMSSSWMAAGKKTKTKQKKQSRHG